MQNIWHSSGDGGACRGMGTGGGGGGRDSYGSGGACRGAGLEQRDSYSSGGPAGGQAEAGFQDKETFVFSSTVKMRKWPQPDKKPTQQHRAGPSTSFYHQTERREYASLLTELYKNNNISL